MKVFTPRPTFNRFTGKPDDPSLKENGFVCDYCGTERKIRFSDAHNAAAFSIHDADDPVIILEGFHIDPEDYPFDLLRLLFRHNEYHFCRDWEDHQKFCEADMMQEWSLGDQKSPPHTLSELFFRSRIRVVTRLISEGRLPNEFDLITPEYARKRAQAWKRQAARTHEFHNDISVTCAGCSRTTLVASDINHISETGFCGSCAVKRKI